MKRSLAGAAVVFSLLAQAGCGTKVEDCNSFAKAASENAEETKKIGADPSSLAGALRKIAANAKAVSVQDETLKPLAKEYADVWEGAAAAAGDIESGDEAKVAKAKAAFEAAEKKESAIVDRVNAYCGGK